MGEGGLEAVPNPSASFLGDRAMGANAHACVTVMLEGTRPLLLEVQALCSRVHHQVHHFCSLPLPSALSYVPIMGPTRLDVNLSEKHTCAQLVVPSIENGAIAMS